MEGIADSSVGYPDNPWRCVLGEDNVLRRVSFEEWIAIADEMASGRFVTGDRLLWAVWLDRQVRMVWADSEPQAYLIARESLAPGR